MKDNKFNPFLKAVNTPAMPQQQIMITESDTIETRCAYCNHDQFDLVYRLRSLPSISPKNPTGKDQAVKLEAFICHQCGLEVGKHKEKGEDN